MKIPRKKQDVASAFYGEYFVDFSGKGFCGLFI